MKRKTLILSAIISITISFSSCAAFERNRTDSKESTITDGQGMDDISIIRSREYDNMTIAEDFRISYPFSKKKNSKMYSAPSTSCRAYSIPILTADSL